MLKDFTKENFDIIIQAGQSNSEGCGQGPVAEPYEPSEAIWYLTRNFTISMGAEVVWGNDAIGNFALPFAREYVQSGRLQEGRKILIVRSSVGGTGFLDHRWGPEDDLYLTMMEMIQTALALNPANRLVALIWHQGESDAYMEASYDAHFANLSGLVESVRRTYKSESLPFIAGDLVQQWKSMNEAICDPVVRAMRDVCATGNGKFVETCGLESNMQAVGNEDTIHFSREALYQLGSRYFEAFCEIE